MSRFQISEDEYARIEEAEKGTKEKRVSQRLRILMMRYEGYKVREIAQITGMRINSISQMCRRYREQGLERFIENKYGGNRRALKEEQEKAILERFEKAAEAGQEVTAAEIKAAFDEVRGKDTGRGYIYMLLERHGWRKVMPRPRHPKAANEEACEASKKLRPACWKREKTCSRDRREEYD